MELKETEGTEIRHVPKSRTHDLCKPDSTALPIALPNLKYSVPPTFPCEDLRAPCVTKTRLNPEPGADEHLRKSSTRWLERAVGG